MIFEKVIFEKLINEPYFEFEDFNQACAKINSLWNKDSHERLAKTIVEELVSKSNKN